MKTIVLASFLMTLSSYSQTISVSALDNLTGRFLTRQGSPLPFGCLVRVGTFDLTGDNLDLVRESVMFDVVDDLFTPLGEGLDGSGMIMQMNQTSQTLIVNDFFETGNIFGQIISPSGFPIPIQSELFLWVLNSPDAESASEWAIVGSSSPAFELPQFPGSTTLTAKDPDIILRGTKSGDNVLLSAIPEPSSSLLSLIGCLVCLSHRQRSTSPHS